VKVIGVPNLPSHDSRRWQNNPHLSVSLAYLRDIFLYLDRQQIRFYRMAGRLAPYLTHPAFPQFRYQLEECELELAAAGDLARQNRLRLTVHPGFYVQLSSPEPHLVQRSLEELSGAADLLDAMGLGSDSVIVIHIGGVHGDLEASRSRFVRHVVQLPDSVLGRFVRARRALHGILGRRRAAVRRRTGDHRWDGHHVGGKALATQQRGQRDDDEEGAERTIFPGVLTPLRVGHCAIKQPIIV
jgi:hypothetical protein